ncbi:HNH endonuclease [Sporolactobacillus sp. CQH2019]|jgi:HNH endonuclease.|uniref:HNH endonuclease n=1 Tax=Sporolactobacillus sp. CQH2019 TaxID=3023512 RepID=UPI0030839E01
MKPWAKKFYRSAAWQKARHAYIVKRYGLCERCGQPGTIVHHKIYLSPKNINNPSIALNDEHFELLCKDCHNKEHFEKYSATRNGFAFDNEGNLIHK